jgi:hypothetical protein
MSRRRLRLRLSIVRLSRRRGFVLINVCNMLLGKATPEL